MMTTDLFMALRRLPGRCKLCAWHIVAQGHEPNCPEVKQ